METLLRSVQAVDKVKSWFSHENSLFTAFMEGELVTNGKMLAIGHGMFAGYWLLRSLKAGYPAMGICVLWFILAIVLCYKVK